MPDADKLYRLYKNHLTKCPGLGITLDISRMGFSQRFFSKWDKPLAAAYDAMDKLEAGAVANADEGRMVGHYWLRAPELAPSSDLTREINETYNAVKAFAASIHDKSITPPTAARFTDLLLIGIGGSALGPQLISDALGSKRDKMKVAFLDNTDPDGIRRTLASLGSRLKSTLSVVISKSGGTPETRNGMLETQAAYQASGLDFGQHAVAVTGEDSKLHRFANANHFIKSFPMTDWVGGRTSVCSAVGLLPMALQGIDIDAFQDGAATMDQLTRSHDTPKNPAAKLALMWHHATHGRGDKDMVVLPYKDRLLLLSRYLQQLVMESLGKQHDRQGNVVEQGLAVYGNKGSTDQHAYVQQLRDGVNNFFALFIIVHRDVPQPGSYTPLQVEPDERASVTSGDYLQGFYLGTRQALYEKGRASMTLACDQLDARTLGAIIALFERAVGLYAELININAYHQPGVEAGKKAAASVLDLQQAAVDYLQQHPDDVLTPDELAAKLDQPEQAETLLHILEHLAANKRLVRRVRNRFCTLPARSA